MPLHPPLPLAVPNQVAKAAFTAACVWQAEVVRFPGQFKVIPEGADTENVLLQDCDCPQSSVTVQVTEVLPPHLEGATGFKGDLTGTELVPPEKLNEFSQALNALLIAS